MPSPMDCDDRRGNMADAAVATGPGGLLSSSGAQRPDPYFEIPSLQCQRRRHLLRGGPTTAIAMPDSSRDLSVISRSGSGGHIQSQIPTYDEYPAPEESETMAHGRCRASEAAHGGSRSGEGGLASAALSNSEGGNRTGFLQPNHELLGGPRSHTNVSQPPPVCMGEQVCQPPLCGTSLPLRRKRRLLHGGLPLPTTPVGSDIQNRVTGNVALPVTTDTCTTSHMKFSRGTGSRGRGVRMSGCLTTTNVYLPAPLAQPMSLHDVPETSNRLLSVTANDQQTPLGIGCCNAGIPSSGGLRRTRGGRRLASPVAESVAGVAGNEVHVQQNDCAFVPVTARVRTRGRGRRQQTAGPRGRSGRGRGRPPSLPSGHVGSSGEIQPTKRIKLPPNSQCTYCSATKFAYESPHFCCGGGTIRLQDSTYPPELVRLFTSQDDDALHFQKYSRMYNNLFAYSSLGGTIDAKTQKGIYVFKLHGQIYHNIPDLIPDDGKPKYLQLYFYDGQHESENRTNCFPEVRQNIIDILMQITQQNPYAKFFRSLREIEINESTRIVLNTETSRDQRVYNTPTSDEVAVILNDNSSSSVSSSPHIVVMGKNSDSHLIKHYYGCYDPLQYPLLFPNGECGWNQGILKTQSPENCTDEVGDGTDLLDADESAESILANEETTGCARSTDEKHVSARAYYCYKLQARPNNLLLRAGRCFQQYIVDMYVKVENSRLDFYRHNQTTIRADLYKGVLDSFETGEQCAANVGRRVILPPSFIGGPRDMKKRYLNAMALVQKYGKPDIFLTVTCNPSWPEIKNALSPGEEVQNRPDIVARVFRAKLLALKKKIKEGKFFGEVAALIYVVEFQKRGLPHAHFLIILKDNCKLRDPVDFDKFVCAEIPTEANADLRALVLKHMIHGPCGVLNPSCACMHHKSSAGVCKYKFPKKFTEATTYNSEGYPLYRRRNTGEDAVVRKERLDNRWVIPYNPELLSLFDCHLNVEVCSTIQAVKYLYKYVYKGHDKISYNVVAGKVADVIDEITQYQSGRWVSPCEAAWRIYSFDLFEMHPPVMPLPIHLPNMQTVQLEQNELLGNVISSGRRARTPLTEFFTINSKKGGTGILYGDFTEKYRWDAKGRTWLLRKNRRIVVGRLAFVSPAEGERYYLRLLLLHVRGPTSYEELLIVDGYTCATYREAAQRRRLLDCDDAVELCMEEAAQTQMPLALRRLFATVLTFCQPDDPKSLWSQFEGPMTEDYERGARLGTMSASQHAIRDVECHLEAMGKSLADYGLDHIALPDHTGIRRTRDITDALDAPIPQEAVDSVQLLNEGQLNAYNQIMACILDGKPGAFFVDGPGGTGKTFLYNALYASVRLMGKIVLPTATSGIAASNIPSGRTAHSRFKIPVDLEKTLACDVPKQSGLAALIKECALIIWDEASMARRENVESLDALLRDLCDCNTIFGGKVVVFGGDFRQTMPVAPHKSTLETVDLSLAASAIWPSLVKIRLTENIRAKSDPEFAAFLLSLGNGELQNEEHGLVELPRTITDRSQRSCSNSVDQVTEIAFPEIADGYLDPDIFSTRAILTPINDDVDALNNVLIAKFPGNAVSYQSFDTMLDDNCNIYPAEFIHKLCPGGMSPHDLILKERCPVILLRNLLPSIGLCNGTRLLCHRFYPNLIDCIVTTGANKGEHVLIPRIILRPSSSASYPFQFQRKQFPIKLSFAMTINKAQGQTLEQVVVYLPKPCFSHGQLYVALSRAKRASKVSVVSGRDQPNAPDTKITNIVSFELLMLSGVIECPPNSR